jgi:biopolymer transport protein ExbB
MDSSLTNTILQAIEQGIMILLVLLGLGCLYVFAQRWRVVGQTLSGAHRLRAGLERRLDDAPAGDFAENQASARIAAGETAAAMRLVRTALDNSALCPEALEQVLAAQESRERERLERGAQFLGTVGANAPFLGLTGTVLGILAAFRKMAESGGGGSDVMAAIAGALIATAAGLLVAIPAVVLYNLLKARIRKTANALGDMRRLLLARSLQATATESF